MYDFLWYDSFSDFKTLCHVQINIIDINDQIPIFEKSDVSSFLVFSLLRPYYLTPTSGIKIRTAVREKARLNVLVNALVTNSDIIFSGNLQGIITFIVTAYGTVCL